MKFTTKSIVTLLTIAWARGQDAAMGGDLRSTGRVLQQASPCDLSGMSEVCDNAKLQAPTPKTNIYDLVGYEDEHFFTNDGYARFTVSGNSKRSELRIPAYEGTGFATESTTLRGVLKLPTSLTSSKYHYTWMQIHGTGTSYIRLAHYGSKKKSGKTWVDYLWLFYKDGSSSSSKLTSIPMIPRPDGDFEATIESGSEMTVTMDDRNGNVKTERWTNKWTDKDNYFKAGSYIQRAPGSIPVDYKELEWIPHSNYVKKEKKD